MELDLWITGHSESAFEGRRGEARCRDAVHLDLELGVVGKTFDLDTVPLESFDYVGPGRGNEIGPWSGDTNIRLPNELHIDLDGDRLAGPNDSVGAGDLGVFQLLLAHSKNSTGFAGA